MSIISRHSSETTNGGVRFAPSPTGRFHIGNLRTAWISFHWARELASPWVVRVEDIDKPRELEGAREIQLRDMENLGLIPDEIHLQSEFHERHFQAFITAVQTDQVYACDCSRKDVQTALNTATSAPHKDLPIYSGRCRSRELSFRSDHSGSGRSDAGQPNAINPKTESLAWRFRMPDPSGRDDFIVARTTSGRKPDITNFVPSYQWACAIDDHFGRYRLLVRASDLTNSARLQRAIQAWLCERENRPIIYPAVFHTALVLDSNGERLSKRSRGVTLPELISTGLSVEQIRHAFKRSFDSQIFKTDFPAGALFGEAHSTLMRADLLPPAG